MNYETEPTTAGKDLIDRWVTAQESERRARANLNSADCETKNAQNALGKWLVPDDGKDGEVFCIWYGDSLFAAKRESFNTYKVEIRKRGRSLNRV